MKYLSIICSLLISTFSLAQESKPFFQLNNDSDIDIRATSVGSYKFIDVTLTNFSRSNKVVEFPLGGFFLNLDTTEQNLVVLFYDQIKLDASSTSEIRIGTACANPNRKAPLKNRTTWVYDYDPKIADLLNYYHTNRSMVEIFTGAEHHSNVEKRQNFLQMCVWCYYNAEKSQIIDFATQYIFDGNKQDAINYVDVFYPLVVTFIDMYKQL